ncbi:hypothetical protein GOB57_24295 [Sinorhizobium meliloti]|nr:hypothetical protein [Sinorhizobium meliloti]
MKGNEENGVKRGRLSRELRFQIQHAIARAFDDGNPDALFASIVDLLEAPFVGGNYREPSRSDLLKALETLGAKAVGQVEHWRRKQSEYPCLEDILDEGGELHLPHDIGPLLDQRSANGRYSEADWWLSTIRSVATDVAKADVAYRPDEGLKAFAKAMIACAFEGGDADGGFIQDKAVEFGLLKETTFDSARHKDRHGWAEEGEQWYEYDGPLSDAGSSDPTAISNDPELLMIERIRQVVPSMGDSGWELASQTWELDLREGVGEALVYRPMSEAMFPYACDTAICRAPKLMDAKTWEPFARYIAAVSPAAVSALVKSHDQLARQLVQVTEERDANSGSVAEAERHAAEIEADCIEQARLNGMGAGRELALVAERERLRRENQRLTAAAASNDAAPSEVVVVRPLEWSSEPDYPDTFTADTIFPWKYTVSPRHDGGTPSACFDPDCSCENGWRLLGSSGEDDGAIYPTPEDGQTAAQADYEKRITAGLGVALFPEDWQLVPKRPYPEVVSAWYRYKNGHHFHDEPPPTDTSDYGAYRAMLEAMPRYRWPTVRDVEVPSVKGLDAAQ